MQALIGIAGLLLVGAITPGPNNFIVMRQAAQEGLPAALRAIVGVLAGCLALLLVVVVGAGRLFAAEPRLALALTAAGGLYLTFLGARLVIASFADGDGGPSDESSELPAGIGGLFVFQFLNPKAWVLVLTATSAVQQSIAAPARLPVLVGLFLLIPLIGLSVWSSLGLAMMRYLRSARVRGWVDRVMGVPLVGFALLLLLDL